MSSQINDETSLPQFKPWQHILQCTKCEDVIYSKYAGEWVPCKCGAIYIDSTPYYSRYGGNKEDIKQIKPNE